MLDYQELAARRYLQYRWQKRKDQINAEVLAIALDLSKRVIPLVNRFGLINKPAIETIEVE